MSLHPQYARPRNAAQAVELLGGLGAGAVVIAGGQELMPHVNYGKLMPSVYVDIGALPELKGVSETDGVVSIGALTVHRELQKNALVQKSLPLLSYAASLVGGGLQVHNRGTVGGNIVAMHPLYDIVPPLLALGAEVEILAAGGTRRAALAAVIAETSHGLGSQALIVRVLVNLLGMYPLGSVVMLGSGEVGVVYHNSNDPRQFETPWVRVVRDASGTIVKKTIIRNLAEHPGPGGKIVSSATADKLEGLDAASLVVL